MFNNTDTATAKTNLSNVARYFTAHKHDDNEFLFAVQYVVEILKHNADGLTERTFQRCWNNMLEVIHRNIMNRGEKMVNSLIHILTVENKDRFTPEEIRDIVEHGAYLDTFSIGGTLLGVPAMEMRFWYDRKEVSLKFA
jgi:hypothetical protein